MLLENHSSHQWHLAILQYSGLENPMDGEPGGLLCMEVLGVGHD